MAAKVFDRRDPSTPERAEGRYVAGRPAAGDSERSGAVQTLAAPQAAHAPGPDLPLGCARPRQSGLRILDAPRSPIHRYLVPGARCSHHPHDNPPSPVRPRKLRHLEAPIYLISDRELPGKVMA